MADRDLTINLKLIKTAAEAASKQYHAGEKQRIEKTLTDAEASEKARTAIIQRENKQRVAAIVAAHKTELDLERERERATRAGNQAINAALRQQAAEEKRIKREQAADEARLLRELAQRHKQNYRERQKEKKEQAAESKKLLKEETEAWDAQESSILNGTKAVGAFAVGMAGLNSVSAVVGEIEAGFQRARDAIYDSTNLLNDYRETLLELAALKNRMGDTSGEMVDTLNFQAKTGQKTEDARAFQLAFHGAAEAFIGPKIADDQARVAEEKVGQMQAVEGGSPEAYANLLGQMFQTMKGKNGAKLQGEDVAREVAAMYEISRPGKLSFTKTAEQFGKAIPYVDSGVLSARDAMGLTAAFSLTDQNRAGTRVDQLVRATVGSLLRKRNPNVDPLEGVDLATTAGYYKGIGAEVGMDPIQITRLVAKDLAAAETTAKAGGRDFDRYAYLQTKGFGNQSDLKALIGATNFIEQGTWDQKFGAMIANPNLGAGRAKLVEDNLRTEVTFQRRRTKAAADTARMAVAAGKPEDMASFREGEYAKLAARNPDMPADFKDVETTPWYNPREILFGYNRQVSAGLERTIRSEAKKRGIHFEGEDAKQLGSTSQAELYRVAKLLQAGGYDFAGEANRDVNSVLQGNLQAAGMLDGGGGAGALNQAAGALNQAAGAIKQAVQAPRPAVMPGRPVQPPAAPPGQL